MATTAINSTTMIDRLYILSRTYENTMVFEPYDSFEELSCNEFVEWSISVVINQESELIDFSGDSKYYQESFINKYPGIPL